MKDSGYIPKKTGSSTNIIIQVNVTTSLEMSWVFAHIPGMNNKIYKAIK